MISWKMFFLLILIKCRLIPTHSFLKTNVAASSNENLVNNFKIPPNVIADNTMELATSFSSIIALRRSHKKRADGYLTLRMSQLKVIKKKGKTSIGFPSLESSLLSLSFLTFAVYLVNLIQVIIKNMRGNHNSETKWH